MLDSLVLEITIWLSSYRVWLMSSKGGDLIHLEGLFSSELLLLSLSLDRDELSDDLLGEPIGND